MMRVSDIAYGEHPNHRLDLYLPEQEEFDLFIYFHGGGLERGSKGEKYGRVTECLEQTHLVLSTLRHFGHEAELKVCHGKHIHYVKEIREDGSNPFAEMILEFIHKK